MTWHPVIAVILALLVESARMTRLRWNFDDNAAIRAWQISVLGSGAMAVLIWLDGDPVNALPRLLGWLPVMFMPLLFVQIFGLKDSIALTTFSFFARQRQMRNQLLGLKGSNMRVNFGNVFVVTCMISSTLGKPAENTVFFLPGLLLISGWALLATKQTRRSSLITALAIAGGLAVAGTFGLNYLYSRVLDLGSGNKRGDRSDEVQTAIGALGEIKQSPEIQWRLKPINGQPPKLLRTASFDKYSLGLWKNDKPGGAAKDEDFADLTTIEPVTGEVYYLLHPFEQGQLSAGEKSPIRNSLPRFNLRGQAANETLLPLPGDTASVRDFDLDGIEKNSLGTVRIFPKNSVIDGTVLWKDRLNPEVPPNPADEEVFKTDQAIVKRLVVELGLDKAPTLKRKLEILDSWFLENFSYTRYLEIDSTRIEWKSALSVFLTTNKRGHCEYFATGATLLLRAAGVPTRYAIGYSVREQDVKRGEFLIRGEHAHAWCRVWDADRKMWIDFDPTPPSWLSIEQQRRPNTQWLSDAFLRFREDFFLWRNKPRNRLAASLVMVTIGLIAAFIIGRRLWRSKHVMAEQRRHHRYEGPLTRTPLHELETLASEILGPRPLGLPFSRWLMGLHHRVAEPEQLVEAIALHQRLRFDPAPPEAPPVDRLQSLVDAIRQGLRK